MKLTRILLALVSIPFVVRDIYRAEREEQAMKRRLSDATDAETKRQAMRIVEDEDSYEPSADAMEVVT